MYKIHEAANNGKEICRHRAAVDTQFIEAYVYTAIATVYLFVLPWL